MREYFKGKNVRIRCKKDYPGAHTHVMIGYVKEETSAYIVVEGKTFHFGKLDKPVRSSVCCGDVMVRGIPWNNIEIIHELSFQTDYKADCRFDQEGNLVLLDTKKTVIAQKQDGIE